jgi:hypothetical protein
MITPEWPIRHAGSMQLLEEQAMNLTECSAAANAL